MLLLTHLPRHSIFVISSTFLHLIVVLVASFHNLSFLDCYFVTCFPLFFIIILPFLFFLLRLLLLLLLLPPLPLPFLSFIFFVFLLAGKRRFAAHRPTPPVKEREYVLAHVSWTWMNSKTMSHLCGIKVGFLSRKDGRDDPEDLLPSMSWGPTFYTFPPPPKTTLQGVGASKHIRHRSRSWMNLWYLLYKS